jgi:hypothetical protein
LSRLPDPARTESEEGGKGKEWRGETNEGEVRVRSGTRQMGKNCTIRWVCGVFLLNR